MGPERRDRAVGQLGPRLSDIGGANWRASTRRTPCPDRDGARCRLAEFQDEACVVQWCVPGRRRTELVHRLPKACAVVERGSVGRTSRDCDATPIGSAGDPRGRSPTGKRGPLTSHWRASVGVRTTSPYVCPPVPFPIISLFLASRIVDRGEQDRRSPKKPETQRAGVLFPVLAFVGGFSMGLRRASARIRVRRSRKPTIPAAGASGLQPYVFLYDRSVTSCFKGLNTSPSFDVQAPLAIGTCQLLQQRIASLKPA